MRKVADASDLGVVQLGGHGEDAGAKGLPERGGLVDGIGGGAGGGSKDDGSLMKKIGSSGGDSRVF